MKEQNPEHHESHNIEFKLNGKDISIEVEPRTSLGTFDHAIFYSETGTHISDVIRLVVEPVPFL